MIYRDFGNTGTKVSLLGFGCMRLPMTEKDGHSMVDDELTTPLIRKAFELGINFFDTHWFYCNFDSQRALGAAINSAAIPRDKVYVSSKIRLDFVQKPDDFVKYLEITLEQMALEYLDFYHFPAMSYGRWKETILPMKLLDQAEKAISKGLMRRLSFSFHSDADKMPELIDSGAFSTMLGQYNLVDRRNEDIFAYAKSKGLGTMVMGPLMGGVLTDGGDTFLRQMQSKAATAAEMSLRFAWSLPSVDMVLSGMSSLTQLQENVKYAERAGEISPEERQSLIDRAHELRELNDLYCTNCNYCAGCPENIRIGGGFHLYLQHNIWGLSKVVKKRVASGSFGGRRQGGEASAPPSACTGCGACVERCPQNIDIPAELKRVWIVLQSL